MKSPLDKIPTINMTALPEPAAWMAGLAEMDEWAAGMSQPFTDDPDHDPDANPEIDVRARLHSDLAYRRRPTRRLMEDFRANPDAYRHLRRLPRDGESLHMIISGKYALFELVPALLERHPGEYMPELYLATLGFSKKNGADLCRLIDERRIRRFAMVCSHYFKGTSKAIYESVVPELLKRGARIKAMRSHAKMIVVRMSGGARYVCESSANLRSCVNVEQAVLTRCKKLHLFHRRWLEHEILNPKAVKRVA